MKRLFLCSSINFTAESVAKDINPKGKKLLFVITATEVETGDLWWLRADREALVKIGFEVTDYTFTNKNASEIEKDIDNYDAMFISGGNTFYLLEKIQESECAEVIKKFVDSGKIYLGSSAGSVIAAPNILIAEGLDDKSKAPNLKDYEGLGLVDFIVLPHWGSDYFRDRYLDPKFAEEIYNSKEKLILLNDNQYVKVEGDKYQIMDVSL